MLPCRPGQGAEAGAWHMPTNKTIFVLVKEVEDLQERLGLFSVSLLRSLVIGLLLALPTSAIILANLADKLIPINLRVADG